MPSSSGLSTTAASAADMGPLGSRSMPRAVTCPTGATAAATSSGSWARVATTPLGSCGARDGPTGMAAGVSSSMRRSDRPVANST